MIPDKLYLSPVIYGTVTNLSPNPDCEGEVEYIRKDALIEWAKNNRDSAGKLSYTEFLDKINSI